MAGEFYTEADIVDLVRGGQRSLELKPGDRMTDLARERADKDGLLLLGASEIPEQAAREAAAARPQQPAPAAPVEAAGQTNRADKIRGRVRKAVIARMGKQVDGELLDRIIERVFVHVGLE